MPDTMRSPGRTDVYDRLKQGLVTGLTLTVPLLITVLVVSLVWGFVFGTLKPLTSTIQRVPGFGGAVPDIILQVVSLLVVVLFVVIVGILAENYSGARNLEHRFDRAMGNIPGIGGVYQTFNEMSELVLDADTDSFQDIQLVEFPTAGSYAIGFVTADTPEGIQRETGHEDMMTIYVPLAPNPLMGGYVLHVSPERCVDVDMSVEDGLKAIMTSGVAVGGAPTDDQDTIGYPDDFPDGIVEPTGGTKSKSESGTDAKADGSRTDVGNGENT